MKDAILLRRVALAWASGFSLLLASVTFLAGAFPVGLAPFVAIPLGLSGVAALTALAIPIRPVMPCVVAVALVGLVGLAISFAAGGASILVGSALAYVAAAGFAVAAWAVR